MDTDSNKPGYRLGFLPPAEVETTLPIRGEIPHWLRGTLYRLSSALLSTRDGWKARHWFDGLAMLYSVKFADGGVRFKNRFVRSRQFDAARCGRRWGHELAASASGGIWRQLLKPFAPPSDNTNINICRVNGRFLAINESSFQYEFDPDTLQTLGLHRYDDHLPDSMTMVAHPLVDPVTQDLFSVGVKYRPPCRIFVYCVRAGTNTRQIVTSYALSRPPWIHSFCLTRRFVILIHHPFQFDPWRFAFSRSTVIDSFLWRPKNGTFIVVIDRSNGDCRYHEAEPFLMIHSANGYDEGDDIIMDLLCYPNPESLRDGFAVSDVGLPRVVEDPCVPSYRISTLKRFRLCPSHPTAQTQTLFDEEFEFPAINENKARGEPYRYLYGIGPNRMHRMPGYLNLLYKFDLGCRSVSNTGSSDAFLSEPIFVGPPNATDEDEGVLLVPVLCGKSGKSSILAFDGRTLEEIAALQIPIHIPFGFHGQFVSQSNTPQNNA